jgi:hypothetical protein
MAAAFGLVILATNSLPGRGRGLVVVCSASGCGWTASVTGASDPRRCPRHSTAPRPVRNGEKITPDCRECGRRLPSFDYQRDLATESQFRCARHGGG